ncbi:MAG: hypothetical protein AAF171_28505 [Cyanobacteria bacterium P01_A01_bin.116]
MTILWLLAILSLVGSRRKFFTRCPETMDMNATRMMVYSHDAFGLNNLRRMLAICEHLLSNWPNLSILLVSGSPMVHDFRLTKGLDYIKLPCLNLDTSGEVPTNFVESSIEKTVAEKTVAEKTVALRSRLIHSAAVHFKPTLLLVDNPPPHLPTQG